MTKKRTTSIESYTLANGEKRYKFQIYVGVDPLTGKEKRTTRSGFKRKKEAELALARIKLEISKGTFRKVQAETYQDIYDLWIRQYEKIVEESTFVKTEGIFRNHILPHLGLYKIDKLNVEVCQEHVDKWANKLKKYRIIKSYAAKVVDFAIKRGYMQINPFKLVDMPKIKKEPLELVKEVDENFYTREQLNKFLDYLKKENKPKVYVLFRLLAYSGMRKGEALALNWKDIDFKNDEIRINKAISRGKDNKLYLKTTKTGSIRTIKMEKETMRTLALWKKQQQKDYLILGFNTLNEEQLVFSNKENEFLQPTKTRKWLVDILKKYNLKPITTHGLRHTHCSLLFEAGANIKEVQDRLGHSDIKTTMDIYTHLTQEAKSETIRKFDNYLNN
ncbi:site-specific integrase [Lysinibacillus fusiformis]|uniref:site-specific integrase n=1 Tax=Lysinibacillus fusiformis TaxID=28031 RepID=UPI001967F4BD|nr:site-specific integrase [Lysinibacillus fusiformis]QSB10855.1 site-specific integrase [Lysinibacillus fusiformis]